MKKFMTLISAAVVSMAMAMPFTASAKYNPTVSFVPQYETDENNTITLSRSDIANGLTIPTYIYIKDDSNLTFSVDLKFKTTDSNISIENILNPQDPLVEYAYAEKDDNGEITQKRIVITYGKAKSSLYSYFTCSIANLAPDRSPLVPYGENSEDYPLTSFDIEISPDTPAGEYQVYFVTEIEDNIEYSHVSKIGMRDGEEIEPPVAENITIVILDDTSITLGDVNSDGFINSADASIILADYTNMATGLESSLTEAEFTAADVNKNGIVDSIDASNILSYYSYLATTNDPVTFEEFLAQ